MPAFYLIQNAHNTFLCMDRKTGRLGHTSNLAGAEHVPLLLALLGPTATCGFLTPWQSDRGIRFLDDAPVFELEHPAASESRSDRDESEFQAYPVLMQRSANSTLVALQDPFRMGVYPGGVGFFLCAGPADAANPFGEVGLNRDRAGEWEHFRLHQFSWRPPRRLCAMISQVASFLNGTMPLAECAAVIAAAASTLEQETWLATCFRALAFPDFIHLLAALPEMQNTGATDERLAAQLRHCLHLADAAAIVGSDGPLAGHAGASDQQADFWAQKSAC